MTDQDHTAEISDKIKHFIAENLLYDPNGFTYADDASFLQEGIIDSLGVMQLVDFVQTNFQVAVPQSEVTPENFDSVARLTQFIARRRQGAAAPTG